MASGALAIPLMMGGVIGHDWMRRFGAPYKGEGAVYGALWMATAVVISHLTLDVHQRVGRKEWLVVHAIGIAGFALALLSGVGWLIALNKGLGYSIPPKMRGQLSNAALLSGMKTYRVYFIGR